MTTPRRNTTPTRRPRVLTYANIVSTIAVLAASTGLAWAALPKGSVTTRQIRNGSLAAVDFATSVKAGLRGHTGSTGGTGATGIAGTSGRASVAVTESSAGASATAIASTYTTLSVACASGRKALGGGSYPSVAPGSTTLVGTYPDPSGTIWHDTMLETTGSAQLTVNRVACVLS